MIFPNTNFNRYDPNDGTEAPAKGDFLNHNDLLVTQCACSAPTVTNDTLNFDCFESSFTANLISNDVISNATFSITSSPTKGTATINPNGQLTYNSGDFFCGVDQLTYQVCNDGDVQCCAEGLVFINFSDNVAPVFPNPPLDMTVSCDELPVLATIVANDACSDIQMLQEESIIQGSCANSKIHVRTWTAFDGCGNSTVYTQNITVEDNVPPVINCLETHIVLCESNTNDIIDSGTPFYSDNCSDTSQLTLSFVDGVLQEFTQDKVVGQFIRTWTVTDECGNSTSCEQLIQIIDDVAPILFCPSDVTVNCGEDISSIGTSQIVAFDSCSAVSLSFVDVGSVPAECNFDAVTISRTWIAEDACGNRTECVQEIIVQGSPCAATITREITEYLCEGATVNLKSMMGFDDNATVTVLDENEQLITNPTTFTLPLTGCATGTFEFVFQTFNEAECFTENSKLIIKTIPNLIMTPFVAVDNCSAELIFECPDLYEVTWSNGSNSGMGNTFIATPRQDGVVLFTIKYIDDNLPDSLDLICLTDHYEIAFDCQPDCPTGIQESIQITGCEGDYINLVNELQLNEGDSIVSTSTIDNFQEFELLAVSDSCGVVDSEIALTIYNADGCPIRNVVVGFEVFKNVTGIITHDDDFCTVRLNLDCPELYNVSWEDNNNVVGFGAEYEGAAGTSGFVTFHVNLLDTTSLANVCGNNTFTADYSCQLVCPDAIERNESLTLCAESTVNIFDRIDLTDDKTYVIDNSDIIDGVYQIGNPFGCEIGTKVIDINGFDSNQCLVEIIRVEVEILPAIYVDVSAGEVDQCTLFLSLECPEHYTITWEDDKGKIGEGVIYTAEENTAGYVKFFVEYATDEIILSAEELSCLSQVVEATYNCISDCPETIERNESFTVCAETTINIFDRLDLSDDKHYVIENDDIIDGVYQIRNFFGCEIGVKNHTIKRYDENQCLVEIINVEITVIPAIYGDIVNPSDSICSIDLALECAENYSVTWEDTDGNSGVGLNYTAAENTAGVVKFTVEYLTDAIVLSDNDLICFSRVFEAAFDCTTDCPSPAEEMVELTGCHGDIINLKERFDFSDNLSYTILNNVDNVRIDELILRNDTEDCSLQAYDIVVEVTDENDCIVSILTIIFNVIPYIDGDLIDLPEGCGVELELACPEKFNIIWSDDLGNRGEGLIYEAAAGTTGKVEFEISFKEELVIDHNLVNEPCFTRSFRGDFDCQHTSTCTFEDKGIVFDGSEIAGCNLLIEMSDGTILEPLMLPAGIVLEAGQELLFSYVELTDRVSVCQSGKIVEIICLENTCPEKGTPCTDGDLATINDAHDGNCNCVGESVPEVESEINLRFRPTLDCASNTYCVMIQGKASQTDFSIGTSSIMVNYNEDALEFADYTSAQFDEKETCIGGTSSPWGPHQYDATSVPGKMCLTMILDAEGASCPEITSNKWEDIGQICFDIMDNEALPNIIFDTSKTHFNSSSPNDGTAAIKIGELHEIDTEDALACSANEVAVSNEVALKAFLQGAYKRNKGTMDDMLRKKGFIPLTEPYTGLPSFVHFGEGGGETTTDVVLSMRGDDAIVDWVFIELRSASDAKTIISTRAGLIQRDGDIVDVDGVSNLTFTVPNESYFISIKHRNHLGAMTGTPVDFSTDEPIIVDFSDPEMETFGTNAQTKINEIMALWGGNANPDKHIILAGGGLGLPDRDIIFFDIFLSLWLANPESPITYNSVLHGYYGSDTNLDGKVKYQGPTNDIDGIIFFNVLFHPENTQFRLNFSILEQIP